MGLVELGWISTLNCLDLDEVIYEDYVLAANRLSKDLREVYKCDYIIALTHMRTYNDVRLAQEAEDIDLILGGHDHVDRSNQGSPRSTSKWHSDREIRHRFSEHE